MHAVGAVAVLTGLAILAFHRDWSSAPAATINAVALVWLLEGAGLLVSTNLLQGLMVRPSFAKIHWVANLLLLTAGSYLLTAFGFSQALA